MPGKASIDSIEAVAADSFCLAILKSLLGGEKTISQISQETGLNRASITRKIHILRELKFVYRSKYDFPGPLKSAFYKSRITKIWFSYKLNGEYMEKDLLEVTR